MVNIYFVCSVSFMPSLDNMKLKKKGSIRSVLLKSPICTLRPYERQAGCKVD